MKLCYQYILYSTVLGVFSSALVFHVGVGFQVFYLVMLFNLFLMLLLKRLWAPLPLLFFFAFIGLSGSIGVLRGTDTYGRFLKELLGIGVSAFYFCSFFRTMQFDLEGCFRIYARTAYWVAIVGIVLFPIERSLSADYRLRSILTEPSMFVLTCIPALYFYCDQWQRYRRFRREALVMFGAFVLAGSSNGFLGILLGIAIFSMRYRRARILLPVVVVLSGLAIYSFSDDFELRLNDSVRALQLVDITGTNLSTFALLSNLFVMEQVLQKHPLLGNGLGSHGVSYRRYIGDVQGADSFEDPAYESINAEDANSLATRLLSDMGILGGILAVWFIWRYRPKGDTEVDGMSKAIWLYLFIKLLRGGHYFSNEQYFFIIFYALGNTVARPRLKPNGDTLSIYRPPSAKSRPLQIDRDASYGVG